MRQPDTIYTLHVSSHLITLITMAPFRPKEAPGPERQLMIKTKACQRYGEDCVLCLSRFESSEREMHACVDTYSHTLFLNLQIMSIW
jgi:hypothetical protein